MPRKRIDQLVPAMVCTVTFRVAVVSQCISQPNAENCTGIPPTTRQSASKKQICSSLTSIIQKIKEPFYVNYQCVSKFLLCRMQSMVDTLGSRLLHHRARRHTFGFRSIYASTACKVYRRVEHHKIQVKFEFGDHPPNFD